ncbi:hypothetical protein AYK25_02975 [Thermoplasmatales archaeon SM1-50]|nr:MAG: hypothetical protein AYK25_02975 [Thermoplasmatales archaeon SM1-50]
MRIKLAVELIIFVLSIITFFLLLRRPYQYLHPGIRNICKENLNKKHFTLGQTLEKMPLGNIPYKLDLCITIVTFKL